MIKLLPKQVEMENKMATIDTNRTKTSGVKLNGAIQFDFNEQEGRFARAERSMGIGETVLVETALCATLNERFSKSHCQHCFTR